MNQKVNKMPLVSDFSRKIITFEPIFCKKPTFKNNTVVMPISCRKKVHPLKNIMLICHFLQICHEKTPAFMPVFGYKKFNSVKTKLYYGLTKSIGFPFFGFFVKILMLSYPYFVKNVHSLKTRYFGAHIFHSL